jgi:DNA-binding FadR family transcriptional regulator
VHVAEQTLRVTLPAGADFAANRGAARRRYLGVAEEVLRAIAIGNLAPGDRLPDERALAQRCGASRSTVREALLALELGGVIEVRPGAGCFVTTTSSRPGPALSLHVDSAPRQMLEVRQLLEPAAARRCALTLSDRDRVALAATIEAAAGHLAGSGPASVDGYLECNLHFHRQIARASGNAVLAELTDQLIDPEKHPLWTLVDTLVGRDRDTRAQQLVEHRAILDAIIAGDGELAEESMTAHLCAMSQRIFGAPASQVRPARPRARSTRP